MVLVTIAFFFEKKIRCKIINISTYVPTHLYHYIVCCNTDISDIFKMSSFILDFKFQTNKKNTHFISLHDSKYS